MPTSSALHPTPYRQAQFGAEHAASVYELAEGSGRLSRQVASALAIIQRSLDQYGAEHLAISFNGGKDCTVLVHLLVAALWHQRAGAGAAATRDLPTLYVRCDSPFPMLEEFIHQAASFYKLSLCTITRDMRSALAEYKLQEPQVEAIIIGTRRTDPHGDKLHDFDRTDVHKGWPDFMRVHPVLDWSYADIWSFLRCPDLEQGVPYCLLYDYGYTSLGSTHDTYPNPELRNESELSLWKPAWMLEDESKERSGRQSASSPPKKQAAQLQEPQLNGIKPDA